MILNLDCRHGLAMLPDNSVHAVVCDPPYEIGFMGKSWDSTGVAFDPATWRECLRVLKPGGHLLAFSGSRTYHRMAVAIEDAGFIIRDQIMWIYGSGMNKVGYIKEAQALWPGVGGSIKPAHEPICVGRKPFAGTLAENLIWNGVGGFQIDGCRVPIDPAADASQLRTMQVGQHDGDTGWGWNTTAPGGERSVLGENGRWPANVIHDGIDQEWARFFYCPKTSKRDRNEGLEHLPAVQANFASGTGLSKNGDGTPRNQAATAKNPHPTVKPTELMRYLCRLVTPPGGLVVDPFAGSGSTGKAAVLEGFQFIGFELDPQYTAIANARIDAAVNARLAGVAC